MVMERTLVVLRHAKSDWDAGVGDRERPLAKRGRRQAPETGRWLAEQGLAPDLALVSPAVRARQTWELERAELTAAGMAGGQTRVADAAYTFDGEALADLVRATRDAVRVLAIVSHNPACEDLVERATGELVTLPTSAVAVISLNEWTDVTSGQADLRYAGRPTP